MGITDDPLHPVQAAILELAQEPPLSGYLLLAYVNGLAINGAINAPVVIDNDSVIVRLDVAEQHRKEHAAAQDASVELKLEIDAEVLAGIDKAKSRTLLENANTLGFIDKALD